MGLIYIYFFSLFWSSNLLPLSFCTCSLLHNWVLVSPSSARGNFTMEQSWTTTFTSSYYFVSHFSTYYRIWDWFLVFFSLFCSSNLLPLSFCTCSLLHNWVLVSPGSARGNFTMEQSWTTTFTSSYYFVSNFSTYYRIWDWFLVFFLSLFWSSNLLPLSFCTCSLLQNWVLVSPGSARRTLTME